MIEIFYCSIFDIVYVIYWGYVMGGLGCKKYVCLYVNFKSI